MEMESIAKEEMERDTFATIYDTYYSRIYGYVHYRIAHRQDTEDLTAKIFIKVLEKYPHYNPHKGSFDAWIFTIAKNTLRDHFRKQALRKFFSLDEKNAPLWEHSPEEDVEDAEEKRFLRQCICALPKTERQLIALRYGAELSYEDIGNILHLSTSHVGVKLHRIIKDLRKKMEEEYEK